METKELKITIPENHEIDWQESAKQEKIVFKKIDNKPRSWEEYCKNTKRNGKYFIGPVTSGIVKAYCGDESLDTRCDRNVISSKELAEAFLAMMQLMSLRQVWIGDWEPDWSNHHLMKYGIRVYSGEIIINHKIWEQSPLSFPTKEMAEDFMNTFKDLLNVAKPLI